MKPPHLVRRMPDRTREQVADLVLQHAVGRKADRVPDAFGFEELVHLRHGEGCVSTKIHARDLALIACDHREQRALPFIGTVNIAGSQRTPLARSPVG